MWGAQSGSRLGLGPVLGTVLAFGAAAGLVGQATGQASAQTLALAASASLSDPLSVIIGGAGSGAETSTNLFDAMSINLVSAANANLFDLVFAAGAGIGNSARFIEAARAEFSTLGAEVNFALTDNSEIFAAASVSFTPRRIFENLVFDQVQPGQGALARSALGGQRSYRYADQREVTVSIGGRKFLSGQNDNFTHYVTASAAATMSENDTGGDFDANNKSLGFGNAISFQVSGSYGMRYNLTEKVSLGFVAGLAYESPREDEGKRNIMGEYEEDSRTSTFDIPLTLAIRFKLN